MSPGAGLSIAVTVHMIGGLQRYNNCCELQLFNSVITGSDFYSCVLYIIKLKGKVHSKRKIQTLSIYPYRERQSGEVLWSAKHLWNRKTAFFQTTDGDFLKKVIKQLKKKQ